MDTGELIAILERRFADNAFRHEGIAWPAVRERLTGGALEALAYMEETGGQPDVIGYDAADDRYLYCDCSAQSPTGRRSLCYDEPALLARKKNRPASSAVGEADARGLSLLTEEDYVRLQSLGDFDTTTSSWIATDEAVRSLGGALFGDKRYGRAFIYHNGAGSYYASRGFRAILRV
ncbi:MAG: DUF4256 domain-containing protein [Actinomycetaceae bacterium]|nr:DUF4256 domain-containing protein [Actinomycetaceae bacterium]